MDKTAKKISQTKIKNNILLEEKLKKWNEDSKKYINFWLINKNKAKIIICITSRGTGKTTGAIFNAMKEFKNSGRTSIILRRSFEEIKELAFSEANKYHSNYYPQILGKNLSISNRGFFKQTKKAGGTYKHINSLPVIQFASINQMRKRTSISFPKNIFYLIDDEITNASFGQLRLQDLTDHFQTYETILRGNDPFKLLIFLNPNFQNEMFFNFLNLEKEFKSQPFGTIRRYKKEIFLGNKKTTSHIAIYKLLQNNKLQEQYKSSEILKFAQSTNNYADYILKGESLIKDLHFKNIKKLGEFKFKLIVESTIFGVWIGGENKDIIQFSRKFNKDGKMYYADYSNYDSRAIRIIDEKLFIPLFKAIKNNKIEFEDLNVHNVILEMLKLKWENY